MRCTTPLAVAFLASLVLGAAGCATHPAPQPVAISACPGLTAYTPSQQADLAKAMQALPPGSPLAGAMSDYLRMRDSDRACLGSK